MKLDTKITMPDLKNLKKAPTKTKINLATYGDNRIPGKKLAPGLILVLVLALAFGKFFVVDRLSDLSDARREADEYQMQINALYAEIDSYSDVSEEYAHYTYSGMTEEELGQVSRTKAIALLDRYVLPKASLEGFSISGNVLILQTRGLSLKQINGIVQELETDDMVSYCTVENATTNDEAAGVSAQVSIYLNQ